MGRRALLLLLLISTAPPVSGGEPEVGPLDCPARALVAGDDASYPFVFNGIVKGLEQAHLPRVSREVLDGDADAVLERLAAEPPVVLFVIGRPAAERLGGRLAAIPRVYVDTAWTVNDEELPPAPRPEAPAAVVRSVVKPVHVAEVLRDVLGGRPVGRLSWPADTPALQAAAKDLALAGGFRLAAEEPPAVLLHLRLGLGEEPAPLSALLDRARRDHLLLLSDDVGHWRKGVPVLVVPDHRLLGRIAADAARELLTLEEPRVIRRRVAVPEVRVDLYAAKDLGLDLPVPFLAGADVLRGPRPAGGR